MPGVLEVTIEMKPTAVGRVWLWALRLAGRLGMIRTGVFCANRIRWVHRLGSGAWKPIEVYPFTVEDACR